MSVVKTLSSFLNIALVETNGNQYGGVSAARKTSEHVIKEGEKAGESIDKYDILKITLNKDTEIGLLQRAQTDNFSTNTLLPTTVFGYELIGTQRRDDSVYLTLSDEKTENKENTTKILPVSLFRQKEEINGINSNWKDIVSFSAYKKEETEKKQSYQGPNIGLYSDSKGYDVLSFSTVNGSTVKKDQKEENTESRLNEAKKEDKLLEFTPFRYNGNRFLNSSLYENISRKVENNYTEEQSLFNFKPLEGVSLNLFSKRKEKINDTETKEESSWLNLDFFGNKYSAIGSNNIKLENEANNTKEQNKEGIEVGALNLFNRKITENNKESTKNFGNVSLFKNDNEKVEIGKVQIYSSEEENTKEKSTFGLLNLSIFSKKKKEEDLDKKEEDKGTKATESSRLQNEEEFEIPRREESRRDTAPQNDLGIFARIRNRISGLFS